MDFSEDDIVLRKYVDSLPHEKKLALAIAISKIFYFDYQQYSQENEAADADLVMDIIQFAERSIGKTIEQTEIENFLSDLHPVMPDQDRLEDETTYNAMCAWAVVVEILELLLDKNSSHLYQVLHYYIFNKLEEKIEEETELNDIEPHPELFRQSIYDLIK
jgi:hypothetical protein